MGSGTDASYIVDRMAAIVGAGHAISGTDASPDYGRDEALDENPVVPLAVVLPGNAGEVEQVLRACNEMRCPVTARGSGTGMSGAAIPLAGGIVLSFARMNEIVEIDTDNHVAVVQAGVTLAQLDEALLPTGLVYPVFPGESGGTIGGNIATNAGGMRAVKYGVTRQNILGLECITGSGERIRSGGKISKCSSGYDIAQMVIGSEGTLALVTQAICKLHPRLSLAATLLAPFPDLSGIASAIPRILESGITPRILEYLDALTMDAVTAHVDMDVGVPQAVRDRAAAYLVVVIEGNDPARLDADTQELARRIERLGAIDVFVLPPGASTSLLDAREKAFWVAKSNGADEIVDVVVPRAAIPAYLDKVSAIAERRGSFVAGCGHAGDGNIHLSVFQPDDSLLHATVEDLLAAGMQLGGAISGEHGIGREKRPYLEKLEDPAKLSLYRRIKAAFDPAGILNPGVIFESEPATTRL